MKTIIAGSRHIADYNIVRDAIAQSGFKITEVVSGCAQGVDSHGIVWARRNRMPVKKCPANWTKYGKYAGPKRNREMAEYADALIAIWDGKSRGTRHMIEVARQSGLAVFIKQIQA